MKQKLSLSIILCGLILLRFNLCWAQCPEAPNDLGFCDTLHVVPRPTTDTCIIYAYPNADPPHTDTICINNPGEKFPCFLYVNLLVTHDSNTFWWENASKWVQDSISAMVVPLGWTRTNPAKYCSLSTYWNENTVDSAEEGYPRRIWRNFPPLGGDSINWMGELKWSTMLVDMSSDSVLYGGSWMVPPHAFITLIGGRNKKKWSQERDTLLATLTFRIEDTMHVCIDSTFYPPASNLAFTRYDAESYVPRNKMPLCIWVGPPRIDVTSPDGGEVWCVGDIHNITWISEGFSDSVKIEYSTNGGGGWNTIIAKTANDGVHPWTIPNTPSALCRVKVSNAAGGGVPSGMSDGNFTISVPLSITVTSPNGGDSLAIGSSKNITWTWTGSFDSVRIELTRDGSTWDTLVARTPNDGSWIWSPVTGPPSNTCKMRISNVVGGVPADTSNNNFTIYLEAPPADFSIHVRPDTLRVARGYSGDYKVVLTSINGFASNCTLTVTEDYPDGATAIFNPPKLVPTDSSILTLTIPANTPEDTFTLTITATEMVKGKGIAHSKDVTLIVVLPAGYFKVDAFPDTQIISQGGSTTYDVTIIPSEDFTAPCTLFVEFVGGLPSGVTADFDSNPIPPNDTSTLTITTQLSTPYGEYDLAIIAVANHEQRDTTYVKLIIGLVANFSAQPTTGPVPLVVNFTDLTLGNPTSWFWYFGDDSASTLPDPIHIYRDTGYYDVKLVVSNGTETDSLIRHNYIQVVPPVVADFSGNPRSGFVSLMVQFTDSSEGNPTSWFWDFGDDSISTERNPIHTYSDTGYFSVKLVASNQWDSDSITKPNYIHVLPHLTADFSASPDSGLRPLSVRFTDLSVGGPTGWLWHFGDGDSSTQRNPVHVYSCEDTGYFDVRLIVWNQTERDTLIKENCIYVSPGVGAKFVAVPTSGAVPLTVQFIDSSLGCPSLWLWNFGDDSTDTTQNPLHTYNDTGYYDVRLIVSSEVDSDTIIKENYIHVLPPNPVLSWADRLGYQIDGVSPDTGLSGSLFTFRVVYTDPRNFAPEGGYPKVNIDLNGDGDFEDENEGSFTMGVVNADTNYTDGREYFYNVVLPASSDCQYSFSAKNSYGLDAVGEPTILKPGPVILDPSTALDLYIYASDITFSDPHPDEGEVFTVFATIHNNSDSNLTNVSVTFYHSGQPPNQVFIPNISSRSSATTSIPLSFDTKGFYPIKVVVDEENSFEEWNELNNFAIRPIIVGDYEFPGGIVVEAQLNSPVYPYSWITVTGNAHYTPEYLGVVSGATVTITIQETGAEYTTYTNDLGNFSMGFYGPDLAGNYSVKVEVTDYTLIDSTILDLEVISQPGVDLAIRINLSKMDSLLQAEQDTLHTRIFNFGSEDAHNFSLGIYKDALLYYSYWVDSLLAGDSLAIPDSVISFDSSGWHTVSGLVDVGDSVEEYNEGNNLSSFGFYVWCNAPDVHIIKLIFSDDSPKGQQPIDITAWVVNSGGVGVVQTFGVQFLDNGVPFDTGYINSLAPFDAETAYVVSDSFIYSDSIQHSFSVFADFQNVIAECNEGNNTYGGGPCIDLKTSYYDINFSDTDPQVGDTVRIIAKVFNLGNISTFNSQVRFKIDGIQIGQDVIIPRINPGGSETVYSSQAWQFNPSACSLVVQCDPANSIIECNEVNNSAYCPLPYDVYPYYACRCPQEYPYVFPYVFSVCATVVDSPVTIFGALRNSGGFDITGQVQIEVTDNIEGLLGIITVDSVLNHGSNIASGDLQHAFANYGWHTVTLRADYNNQYYECGRESNNTYSASIFVDSLRPDLEVHSEYIQFSDDCPNWGDSLWFRVSTYNIGQSRAENVWIRFLVDELQIGADILIDSIPVGPNNYHTDTSTAPWIVPEELDVTHVCKVIVDPNNQILEVREDNNEATRALPVVRCGDVNRDCVVNIADVVYLINYLYIGGTAPEPWQTGDVNCDGTINVSDVVYLINYLFIGGPPPGC